MRGTEVFLTATDLFLFGCLIFGIFTVAGWFFPRGMAMVGATHANSGTPASLATNGVQPVTTSGATPAGFNAPARAWGDIIA